MSGQRGANYRTAEDKALCEAWLNVSGDGATGTNQSGEDFYKKVKDVFENNLGTTTNRKPGSLNSRFQTISRSVSKFVACHARIEALQVSGRSPDDVKQQAVELYESEYGVFRFMQCWYILKESPTWRAWRQGSQKKGTPKKRARDEIGAVEIEETKQDSEAVGNSTEGEEKRPTGQQRAKLERTNLALYARQVQATERMAKNAEARVRVAQDQFEQNLFGMEPNNDDADSVEFVVLKRRIILARLRKEAASLEASTSTDIGTVTRATDTESVTHAAATSSATITTVSDEQQNSASMVPSPDDSMVPSPDDSQNAADRYQHPATSMTL